MKKTLNILKYILSISGSPATLAIMWFFDIRPFSYIYDSFKISKDIPDNGMIALDLALLLLIYNLLIKCFEWILTKIEKPISISFAIIDQSHPDKNNSITIYANEQKLHKLTLKVQVNYKHLYMKKLTKPYLEIHWSRWITLEINESKSAQMGGTMNENDWKAPLLYSIGEMEHEMHFDVPMYITPSATFSKKAYIIPKLNFDDNKAFSFLVKLLMIEVKEKKFEIILKEG